MEFRTPFLYSPPAFVSSTPRPRRTPPSSHRHWTGEQMTTESEACLLRLSSYDLGGFRVLDLTGDCDLATWAMLRDGLAAALAGRSVSLIVDMSHVKFCDGHSMAMILNLRRRTARLAVVGLESATRRVFDVLDPTGEVLRYRSVDAAARHLAGLP